MARKLPVQIELIPNMYDLGLFKRCLESRRRLRMTASVALLVLTGCFLGAGHFIRYWSSTPVLNIFLVIALYFGVLVVSYLVALVLGDLFFSGPWLEKMRRGSSFVPEDLASQKALMKNRSLTFIAFWTISIAILGVGCDLVTGGNIRWFHTYGGILVSLRSEDASERAQVLKTLSNPFYDTKWSNEDIRAAITERLDDTSDEVRRHAAYLSGRAKISESAERLEALLTDESASVDARGDAAIALGRLEWKPARSRLITVLRKASEGDDPRSWNVPLVMSSLYGFYEMRDAMASQDAIHLLDRCLEKGCDERVLQYAFFYLKSLRVKDGAALSFRVLDSASSGHAMQCYAADLLRFTASKKDVPAMKRVFERTPIQSMCPVVYRKYREEAAIIMFEADPMRALFVRAIGNINDRADDDWIWMVGSDVHENLETRKVAEVYARAHGSQ